MAERIDDPTVRDDRTLGELFAELSRETTVLVKKEFELAKTEMTAKAKTAGTHAALAAAGGALMHAGLLVLLAGIVLALAAVGLPSWVSALLVAAAVMAIGYTLAMRGVSRLRRIDVTPTQTMESLKENATWTTRTRA